jgi:predicted transcriptional regulator
MTELTINQQINVPEGCYAMTRVYPIKHLSNMPHARVFFDGVLTLTLDKELTGQDIRVFWICVTEMEYENILDKTQSQLAAIAEIKQPDVAKSLKKLLDKGFLRVIGHKGRQNVYRINPLIVVKTRAKNVSGLIDEWNSQDQDLELVS